MGMFDRIQVSAPYNEVIDKRVRNEWFQTKDLDCTLGQFVVDEQGRLSGKSDYHGDIFILTTLGLYDAGNFEVLEYQLRFTDGKLAWIKQVAVES